MSDGKNWRETDEGYWIGVVEGMEAAASICDDLSARARLGRAGACYRTAAEQIRRAMTEGEINKRRPEVEIRRAKGDATS